ncbi:dehydrogenase [Paenibacillus swuensis]|uniref:Dehydrogenase n=1 Tax=Paenibacillus swuensis TaxID=1178515 RepID=A0A172TE49_9BACL|nr:Gfo/Idh/MocA family oxidoreductase [Paenibacillus swuensis]ANE45319.1 dehydrogenase [Paenibacillus swuensis]
MDKLKVGMISFAHLHAHSYLDALVQMPDVVIVGIADENRSRVEDVLNRYQLPYYENYHDLLATDVDAVVICSENAYHAQMTIDAARAGKNVLCEKPLGISVQEMERMIEVCKENDVQLMTAFPCRYLAAVVQAKKAIDDGEIGNIVAIKGTNRGSFPQPEWFADKTLSGGGAVMDHTVHVMDLMNWFLGSRVVEVHAYAESLFYGKKIDDSGMVHVKFDNGVFAVLDPSWSRTASYPTWGDVTMEIVGTKGVLSIDSFAQKNVVYSEETGKGEWSYWGDNMDLYMLKAFVQAILDGNPVPISGEDGLRSVEVALGAYESATLGRPVTLPQKTK